MQFPHIIRLSGCKYWLKSYAYNWCPSKYKMQKKKKKKKDFFLLLNLYWYQYPWGKLFERKDLHVYRCERRTAWWGMEGKSLWHGACQPMSRSIHTVTISSRPHEAAFEDFFLPFGVYVRFCDLPTWIRCYNDNKTCFYSGGAWFQSLWPQLPFWVWLFTFPQTM